MNAYETARALCERGYFPIPLIPRTKAARDKKWQQLRITSSDIDEHFAPDGVYGVGILTGLRLRENCFLLGLDIDIDDHDLKRNIGLAFDYVPPAKMGKKGCTYFVQMPHAMKKGYLKRKDPVTKKSLNVVELLAEGQQTVLPPSIHPDTGGEYVWLGVPLQEIDPDRLPVYDAAAIAEVKLAVERPDSPVFFLNSMQWLGEEGGGDIHNSVLAAVAALVQLGWDDDMIWKRVDRATRVAVEGFGDIYDWPGWEEQVRKMAQDARAKGFEEQPKKERIHRIVARWFMDEFLGEDKCYYRDGQLALYKKGAFDIKGMDEIKHFIATRYKEPEGISLISSDWRTIVQTIMDLSPRFPDRPPHRRVCMGNGTFDMDSGMLGNWRPDDFLISRLDMDYDPDAKCPVYERFLQETFAPKEGATHGEEDRERAINTYEEFVAHTLFEYTGFHKFLVIKGQPRTGKSTLVAIAQMLHSPTAVSAVPVHEFGNERYRTSMVGKLLNVVTEVASTSHAADDFLKAVTAGDPVQVRYLYAEPILVKLPTRLLIACNEMFRTRDTSGAVEARMLLLSCDNFVEEEKRDIELISKLRDELPGIFNRMYAAWQRLKERNRFEPPSYSSMQIALFTMENNPVLMWLQERTNVGQMWEDPQFSPNPDDFMDVQTLYMDYAEWSRLNGYKQCSSSTFAQRLANIKTPKPHNLDSVVRWAAGKSRRVRLVKLNSPTTEF